MSFKLFIYYCALCGAWAAFLAWGLVQWLGVAAVESPLLHVICVGGILGCFGGRSSRHDGRSAQRQGIARVTAALVFA